MTPLSRYEPFDGREITHQCPPVGSNTMPCCGLTPFEVNQRSRMTLDPKLVTCRRGRG